MDDFTSAVLQYFVDNFPAFYEDVISPDITLPLEVLRGPLQDDPTVRAPYLIIQPDKSLSDNNSHWRVPVSGIKRGMLAANQDFPSYEVGGSFLYINFFTMEGWMPEQADRESAYAIGGRALRRAEVAYARMAHTFSSIGITTSDGQETTVGVPFDQTFTWDGGHYEIAGGDTTWFPKLYFRFHVFSRVDRFWMLDQITP